MGQQDADGLTFEQRLRAALAEANPRYQPPSPEETARIEEEALARAQARAESIGGSTSGLTGPGSPGRTTRRDGRRGAFIP